MSSLEFLYNKLSHSPTAADDFVIKIRRKSLQKSVVVHEDKLQLHGAPQIWQKYKTAVYQQQCQIIHLVSVQYIPRRLKRGTENLSQIWITLVCSSQKAIIRFQNLYGSLQKFGISTTVALKKKEVSYAHRGCIYLIKNTVNIFSQ